MSRVNIILDLDDTLLDTTGSILPEANRLACEALHSSNSLFGIELNKLSHMRRAFLNQLNGEEATKRVLKELNKDLRLPSSTIDELKGLARVLVGLGFGPAELARCSTVKGASGCLGICRKPKA